MVVGRIPSEQPAFKLERPRELLPFLESVDGTYVARLLKNG